MLRSQWSTIFIQSTLPHVISQSFFEAFQALQSTIYIFQLLSEYINSNVFLLFIFTEFTLSSDVCLSTLAIIDCFYIFSVPSSVFSPLQLFLFHFLTFLLFLLCLFFFTFPVTIGGAEFKGQTFLPKDFQKNFYSLFLFSIKTTKERFSSET